MKARAHFVVYGLVQGVGYRNFAYQQAVGLNLNGYVHNLPNRTVESIVEGDKDQITMYFEALKKGPYFAKVDRVSVNWKTCENEFVSFDVFF